MTTLPWDLRMTTNNNNIPLNSASTVNTSNPYSGYTITTDTTVNNALTITSAQGDKVSLSFEMLMDLKLLLDEINELPETHPLAELKQGLNVRKALHILGKK